MTEPAEKTNIQDGVEVRAIREEEREECIKLWCAVFKFNDNDAYFRRYFFGDVEWLPYYTQVALVDGKMVSAVHICKRTVACGDLRLTMGGIANVVTLPKYRKRGLNTRCLQSAVAVMEADAMDFSLLFTGIIPYYERLGYASLTRESFEGAIRPDLVLSPSPYTVRDAVAEDLPAIRACYDSYNKKRPLTVQRYEAYWRDWLRVMPDRIPYGLIVAVDAKETVAGYAFISPEENTRAITELCIANEAAILPLIETAAARSLEKGRKRLGISAPMETPVRDAAEQTLKNIKTEVSTGAMARVLHRDNLFRSWAMEMNDRWIRAQRPQGMLTFQTPYGLTRLDATGAFLRVGTVEEARDVLPQSAFFHILFGFMNAASVSRDAAVHPLIRALLPAEKPVYYRADGF